MNTFPESQVPLSPVPLPFLVDLIQGSSIVKVVTKIGSEYCVPPHHVHDTLNLKRGDRLRIHSPQISIDWAVSPDPTTPFNNDTFTLLRPYDHSRIIQIEAAAKENELMCQRLTRRSNNKLPGASFNNDYKKYDYSDSNKLIESMDDRKNKVIEDGMKLCAIRVWKLVPLKEDNRPAWKKQYDDGEVAWENDFVTSPHSIRMFGIHIKMSVLENLCRDVKCDPENSLHMQRVNYATKVDSSTILREAFQVICHWHPVGKLVDHVKWAKFARKMNFLSGVQNAKHEVDMAFFRQSSKMEGKKLSLSEFIATIGDISKLWYPELDGNEAMTVVIWNTVVMLPSVNRLMWYEAKLMAMKDEARQIAAQIVLSNYFRKSAAISIFKKKKGNVIVLAKYVRRVIAQAKYFALKQRLENDMIYRWRVRAVINIQSLWRCYHRVYLFKKHLRSKAEADQRLRKEHQAMMRMKRQRNESGKVYQRVHEIKRVLITVTMWLKEDKSCHDIEKVLLINAYIQGTSDSFNFTLNESDLRKYMEVFFLSNGPLSWSEMLTKPSLMCLSKRLMVRFVNERYVVIFRRRSITENGELLRKQCLSVNGIFLTISVFLSTKEMVVSSYDPLTSEVFRVNLLLSTVRQQLLISKDKFTGVSLDQNLQLLLNRPDIIDWFLSRLTIALEKGQQQLIFAFENVEEKRRILSSVIIQSKWRQITARLLARRKVTLYYEKFYDSKTQLFYYMDKRSNQSYWQKPNILGQEDLVNPSDEWRVLKDESGYNYYFNPATGQTTYLSEEKAAIILQRFYRKYDYSQLIGARVDIFSVSKTIHLIDRTISSFEKTPDKLVSITNFALYLHCIKCDYTGAKTLYENAISRSPTHPLIQRAYGICLMVSKEEPWLSTTKKCNDLFRMAKENDPDFVLFKPAIEHFFKWSIISKPRCNKAILNFALLYQCVINNYDQADKLYRRALSISPQCILIKTNFEFFDAQRYPGGLYEGTGPSISAVIRSKCKKTAPLWGEWSLLFDPNSPRKDYSSFWYDKLTKKTSFEEPNWSSVWQQRIRRSEVIQTTTASGLIGYYDPRLREYFFQNTITGECAASLN